MLLQSGEAKDVTRTGDAKEEETAIGGSCGDFDTTAADDQKMVGCKAFADKDCTGFATSADANGVEVAKDCTRKRADVLGSESRSVCITARKHGGPLGTQREVACAD